MHSKNKKIRFIGGIGKYGSGVIVEEFLEVLKKNYETEFHNTQSMRIKGTFSFFNSLIKERKINFFQPSVSMPAFLRDCLINILLILFRQQRYYILLTRLDFRNSFFKSKIFRYCFFGNSQIFSTAKHEQIKKNFHLIRQFSPLEKIFISENNHKSEVFLFLGYLERFKGFNEFVEVAKSNKKKNFIAIGENYKNNLTLPGNIQLKETNGPENFKEELIKVRKQHNPYLLYTSLSDLSPLILLECGILKIPIICFEGGVSHQILKNYLPKDCFVAISNLKDYEISEDLIQSKKENLYKFSLDSNKHNFQNHLKKLLIQIL